MQFANICPCAEAKRLPRLVRRKVAILRAFTVGFEKFIKSCLFLLTTLRGLIDTLCTVANLKVPAMIVYDMAAKVLGRELFPKHNIADLNSGITFIALFSQEKPLR